MDGTNFKLDIELLTMMADSIPNGSYVEKHTVFTE